METDRARAARLVRGGGVLLYPTETVYGLGGDARRPDVAARIHRIKGSAPDKPLLALTDAWSRVEAWVEAPPPVRRLWEAEALEPLTLVLLATGAAPRALVSAEGFVGLRRSTSDRVRALVAAAGVPLFSTSANPTGTAPPSHADAIDPALHRAVDLALVADAPLGGQPSTVARYDAAQDRFDVLRPGPVSEAKIARLSGVEVG